MLTQKTAEVGVFNGLFLPHLKSDVVTSQALVNEKKERSFLYGIHHGLWQFLTCGFVTRGLHVS